jgi:flagellar biosynthetic protein FliO
MMPGIREPAVLTAAGPTLTDSFVALALTLLILAAVWYLTRRLIRQPGSRKHLRHLQVVERLPLGRDRQILLVKVGREYFLAGVTSHGITFSPAVELPDFASFCTPLTASPPTDSTDHGARLQPYQSIDRLIRAGKDLIHARHTPEQPDAAPKDKNQP